MNLSIIVPVHNEGECIGRLMSELSVMLDSMKGSHEVIWVNDGSTDATGEVLARIEATDTRVRVIAHQHREGQSSALWDGLTAAQGEILVTIDGDGQNDPADIPMLLAALENADFVLGWRRERRDPLVKRVFSATANWARNVITGSRLPDSGCALRAFRRSFVGDVIPFRSLHRFLPTLAELRGLKVKVVQVRHRPRSQGRSKYGVFDRIIEPLAVCLWLKWTAGGGRQRRAQAVQIGYGDDGRESNVSAE